MAANYSGFGAFLARNFRAVVGSGIQLIGDLLIGFRFTNPERLALPSRGLNDGDEFQARLAKSSLPEIGSDGCGRPIRRHRKNCPFSLSEQKSRARSGADWPMMT